MEREHLVVYGTLLLGIKSQMAQFLESNSRFLGALYVPGLLYDLGHYPGFIYDLNAPEKVFCHLFEIIVPKAVFPILDQYEMIDPFKAENNEYRRTKIPIEFEQKTMESWVYEYNFPTSGLRKITGGNYLEYVKWNRDHQGFIKGDKG